MFLQSVLQALALTAASSYILIIATDLKFHFQDRGMSNDCRLSLVHNAVGVCDGVECLHFGDSPTSPGYVDINTLDVDCSIIVQLCVCVCVHMHMDG